MKMRLYLSLQQNNIIQQHQIMSAVVSAAFGSGEGSGNQSGSEPPAREVQTEADAMALLNMLNR